ncbi:MAG: hypothetical protein WAZ77_10745 [Candidatus Nitrosopolaris sp.]
MLYLHVGAALLILLSSTLLTNAVFGQIFPNTQHSTVLSNSSTLQQQQSKPNLHLVKIISPTKGQQVRLGGNLLISGTSTDNTTSDCKVTVIVNGIKPGQNKITSKFSCSNDPNLASHNSVNVTGVATSLIAIANQQQQYTGKNLAASNLTSTSTSTRNPISLLTSSPTKVANTRDNSYPGIMSVSIHLAKSVHPGDKQSLIIKVSDANSTAALAGASVLGRVIDPSGALSKKLEGTTNDTGKSSYSWTVSQNDTSGKYKTIIDVSAPGYQNNTASKTFKVSPMPVTITTTSNNNLSSMNGNNIINPNELAQKIINQVKQKLEGHGIPLP